MEDAVPDCLVSNYDSIENSLELPNPNDRHVLAAAIHCGSNFLLTENLRDFPQSILSHHYIHAVTVDTFLSSIMEQYQYELRRALESILKRLKNPPVSIEDWCLRLGRIGFPRSSKFFLNKIAGQPSDFSHWKGPGSD
ncbi:MAG: hypothetical protein WB791_11105 [Waddliaceae bacterium]